MSRFQFGKLQVWLPKVIDDLNAFFEISIHSSPESCVNLTCKIDEIKEFKLNGQELVHGWLISETSISNTASEERVEILTWEARDLSDVVKDLQQLARDLSASLNARHDNCLSRLQTILMCIDIDTLFSLLVGKQKQNGYPDLKEENKFVQYGKDDFKLFYGYVCFLSHVKELAENHFTKLKLKQIYSDEILTKLKDTLKIVLWTPKYAHILCKWLKCVKATEKGNHQVSFGKVFSLQYCFAIFSIYF